MKRWPYIAWVLALAVLIHLDWHAGRPHHMRLSLAWAEHWLCGLLFGAVLGLYAAKVDPRRAILLFGAISAAGFFVGQIIEPALEVLFYHETFAAVNPPVRWQLFGEFAAAWLVGGFAALAVSRWRRPRIATSS